MTRQSKGFSTVEILIALVVLIAAAVGGWFVWHKNQNGKPKQTQSSTNTKQNDSKQQSSENQQQSDPSEGGKYLVIKEWGVRFPINAALKGDTTYSIVTSTQETAQTTWFEVGKVAQLPGSNCKLVETDTANASGKSGGIGVYLARVDTQPSEQVARTVAAIIKLGNHWYYYGVPKGSCLTDQSNTQPEDDAVNTLVDGLKQLQLVPSE